MARRLSTFGLLYLFIAPQLSAVPPRLQIDHQGAITCVAWSADGLRIATASGDGTVRVLDSATGKELHRFASGRAVRGLALAPDGKSMALSQEGTGVHFWNFVNGQRQQSNNYTNYSPEHLAFTPDSQKVLGIGVGALFVWQRTGAITIGGGVQPVGGGAAVAPDAALGGWVEASGLLILYAPLPTGGVRTQNVKVGAVRCIALGSGGKLLAVGGADSNIQLWNLTPEGRKKIGSLTGLHNPPARLAIATDGSALAAVEADGTTLRIWDLARQRTRRQIAHYPGPVGSLALSPDGKLLATTGPGGNALLVWNVATRELTQQGPPRELSARDLAGLWTDLADKNHAQSDAAWRKLAAAGDQALPFLKGRIRPIAVPPLDQRRVEQLLAELDSDHFATREKATRELTSLGEVAIVPLQRSLEKPSSLEAQRRAQTILKQLPEPVLTPDRLRTLEVLELLEQLRSPPAVALLQEIARNSLIPQIRRAAHQAAQRAAAAREEKK